MEANVYKNEFRIQRLRLENYRCFGELTVSFHDELTVLVAHNGGGKTAILDAVAVALRLFVDTMEARTTSKGFSSKDIRLVLTQANIMELVTPVRLEATGSIFGQTINWARERQSETSSRTTTAEALDLKKIATKISFMNQKISRIENIKMAEMKNWPMVPTFPIVSYYGTGRLWSTGRFTEDKRTKLSAPNARFRGYTDCLSSSSHYKFFIDWFRRFSYEAEKGKATSSSSIHSPGNVLQAVCNAVDIALEPSGWRHIQWDFAEDCIVADHPVHGRLPVDILSDGIRNIIGLVADIAHRMAKLNPQLGEDVATQTPGIILIDEVDMHLHPAWQQQILRSLKAAFPEVQLIVSTHSPQVLSTLRKENIRVLLTDDDGIWSAIEPLKSPLGHESKDALAFIMDTHPRPELPEISNNLHAYEKLVRSGQGKTEPAINLLKALKNAGFEFNDAESALFEILSRRVVDKENDQQ